MLRLGNIDYSNCYPIHGPLLEGARPPWLEMVDGTPSDLNRRLAKGELDIAPGSSIELARHAREYAALSGLCIGSDGPVESIILATRVPPDGLDGRIVSLPTASATSRCLLRILLEIRLGVRPNWADFDQQAGDPLLADARDADAEQLEHRHGLGNSLHLEVAEALQVPREQTFWYQLEKELLLRKTFGDRHVEVLNFVH